MNKTQMGKNNLVVNIVGAGLAGCEACYQLLMRGVTVNLYEMKPVKFSQAHKNSNWAELVCSNSLKSNDPTKASGLLKQELRELNSFVISVADSVKVPAGGALAVDRDKFSEIITNKLKSFKNLNIINGEVTTIPSGNTIIATGPLTSDSFSKSLQQLFGLDYYYFFDAIAPIVDYDTIDFSKAFLQDRYDKGTGDYINCPMNKQEYETFYDNLINAQIVELKDFENQKVYEGCMPIEVLAKRGHDSMRFGPLKPVGLTDPNTSKRPYAVVQLRKETVNNDFYNMVGFQTNLTYPEQKRVFKLIPGLENAEFLRLGTMHKNCYINAPMIINNLFQCKNKPNLFVAGQLSGVEGYVESISSGFMSAINMYNYLTNSKPIDWGTSTIMGALSNYIATAPSTNFQPMSANMGLIGAQLIDMRDKQEKNNILSQKSLDYIKKIKNLI